MDRFFSITVFEQKMQELFRIKICGVTRPIDVPTIVNAGADAIGLNFFPSSSRFVNQRDAQAICQAVSLCLSERPQKVWKVGVFVNETVDQMAHWGQILKLDGLQLHGDEKPEIMPKLRNRLKDLNSETVALIRAIRIPSASEPISADRRNMLLRTLDDWTEAGITAILLDVDSQRGYGGTGETVDWNFVAELKDYASIPLILAGGLNPENVATALYHSRADRVDVASGVELAPGIKDPVRVQQFVANSRLTAR